MGNRRTRSLIALVRQAARLDQTVAGPWVALRNAVGFTAPMVIGALAGSISAALSACAGALLTSFADQPG